MVTENGFNQRNIWFGYYALGISLLLFIGTHLQIDRFMWATFASSSLFLGIIRLNCLNEQKNE